MKRLIFFILFAYIGCAHANLEIRGSANPTLLEQRFLEYIETRSPCLDRPCMAILIDDVGESMEQILPFLNLPLDLSFSILPIFSDASYVAKKLKALGRDILLHIPMEPLNQTLINHQLFIATTMDVYTIENILERMLSYVPFAVGANNHMGSKFTQDCEKMQVVFSFLKKRGLYFIDSRTDPNTCGRKAADKTNITFYERDVFLDHELSVDAIKTNIDSLVNLAKTKGRALGIGHPNIETYEALSQFCLAPDLGVVVVPVSYLVAKDSSQALQSYQVLSRVPY